MFASGNLPIKVHVHTHLGTRILGFFKIPAAFRGAVSDFTWAVVHASLFCVQRIQHLLHRASSFPASCSMLLTWCEWWEQKLGNNSHHVGNSHKNQCTFFDSTSPFHCFEILRLHYFNQLLAPNVVAEERIKAFPFLFLLLLCPLVEPHITCILTLVTL